MPSAMTHAVVGLGLAHVVASRPQPPLFWGVAAGLAMLPDVDVLAFSFHIPYGAPFGHRGFTHSIFCALVVGLAAALLTVAPLEMPWWYLWAFYAAVMASHGLLDAMTNGGMGIGLLAPFDWGRYFFPWQPIQVAPIGLGFLSRWGLRAFVSELLWVWLPLAVLVGGVWVIRGAGGRHLEHI
jgi:inner membrane protein